MRLKDALGIPETMTAPNRSSWSGLEGLLVLLRTLAFPARRRDLERLFGRGRSTLSVIFNTMLEFLCDNFGILLDDLGANAWLTAARLEAACNAVGQKCPLQNVCGFIDGTVRKITRPMEGQRLFYSGHKRCHCLKYQSVATPFGIITHLCGPVEGRRHDAAMLAESGLLEQMEEHMVKEDGSVFSLYGDSAYPMRAQLLCPFAGAHLTPEQEAFNKEMSEARVCVEWMFGRVTSLFPSVDFSRNHKILLQPVAKYYRAAVLLTNCHACLYGNETSAFFGLEPPHLEAYLYIAV